MKYLSSDPIFFGPPRPHPCDAMFLVFGESDLERQAKCDHQGKRHIFNGEIWKCECGSRL